VRLFVSEYICSGAWLEPDLPPSLAREGRAMLLALLTDLAQLPDVTLCTTWDARLGEFPFVIHRRNEPRGLSPRQDAGATGINPVTHAHGPNRVECTLIHNPRDEAISFQKLAAECDATYIIAPELDDLLAQRVQSVHDAGGHSLNAAPEAIHVCSDKWETFRRFTAANISTVPTARFVQNEHPFPYPVVIKPRFGAGSQDTFLVRNDTELHAAAARFPADTPTTEAIVQPFIAGRSLSVAANFRPEGTLRELWPIGDQHLSTDGRFTYLGGRIPSPLDPQPSPLSPLSTLISRLSTHCPGLSGYVGFDVIVPLACDAPPLIVDINPRLTTSYLGYRALTDNNLAARILWPDHDWPPVRWHDHQVSFDANGEVARSSSSRG